MIYFITFLIILILLILFFIFSDVTIHVILRRSPDYQKSIIQILFLNTIKLFDKKLVSKKQAHENSTEKLFEKIDKYSEIITKSFDTMSRYNDFLRDINNNLGNGLKTSRLNLATRVGTGDSAVTGILCGIIWTILGNLRTQKDYYNLFKNVEFSVNPDFKKKIFAVDIDSIFTIKTAYIIYVLVSLNNIFKLEEEKTKAV